MRQNAALCGNGLNLTLRKFIDIRTADKFLSHFYDFQVFTVFFSSGVRNFI